MKTRRAKSMVAIFVAVSFAFSQAVPAGAALPTASRDQRAEMDASDQSQAPAVSATSAATTTQTTASQQQQATTTGFLSGSSPLQAAQSQMQAAAEAAQTLAKTQKDQTSTAAAQAAQATQAANAHLATAKTEEATHLSNHAAAAEHERLGNLAKATYASKSFFYKILNPWKAGNVYYDEWYRRLGATNVCNGVSVPGGWKGSSNYWAAYHEKIALSELAEAQKDQARAAALQAVPAAQTALATTEEAAHLSNHAAAAEHERIGLQAKATYDSQSFWYKILNPWKAGNVYYDEWYRRLGATNVCNGVSVSGGWKGASNYWAEYHHQAALKAGLNPTSAAATPVAANTPNQQTLAQTFIQAIARAAANAALLDSAIRSYLNNDNVIDRTEMLLIFSRVTADDVVSQGEYLILRRMQDNPGLYPELDYVHYLADAVMLGFENVRSRDSGRIPSASELKTLVNKWFLGADNPIASAGYQLATGSLFVNGLSYTDIDQGALGDCYFMAALAELAFRDPNAIYNMFIDNHDGTFTVRFFNNGKADYVTVDRQLPTSGGSFVYANNSVRNNSNAELWAALAEKAYVKMRAQWAGSQNSNYSSIDGGYAGRVLSQITNRHYDKASLYSPLNGIESFDNSQLSGFATLWNAGALITAWSYTNPSDSRVGHNHYYAVVGYNAATRLITLFNPWGIGYGLLTLSWNALTDNFRRIDWVAGSFARSVLNLIIPEVIIPPTEQTGTVSTTIVTVLEQNVTPAPKKPILLQQLFDRYGSKLPVKWQTGLNEFVKKVETERLESQKKIVGKIQERFKTATQKAPVKKKR